MSKKSEKTEYTPQPVLPDLSELPGQGLAYKLPVYAKPVDSSITAQKDLDVVILFLQKLKENQYSYASYRSELERFLHWSWHIEKASLINHDEFALARYLKFFKAPTPAANWIGTTIVPRFLLDEGTGERTVNPDWRPFVAKVAKALIAARHDVLKAEAINRGDKSKIPKPRAEISDYAPAASTIAAAVRILSSLYEFMAIKKMVPLNYVKLIPQRKTLIGASGKPNRIMRVTKNQWKYVIKTAELMADNDDKHERTLFIMSFLYLNYLRISELVHDHLSKPMMSDFWQDPDENWWLHIVGKGVKDRDIPISDDMLKALARYREHRGLQPYPTYDEEEPLILVERTRIIQEGENKGEIDPDQALRSTRAVRELVQQCFDQAYERMLAVKTSDPAKQKAKAASLRTATVHWLRHTGISEDVKRRKLTHVMKDAGHEKIVTTGLYIEVEDQDRHETAKTKKLHG